MATKTRQLADFLVAGGVSDAEIQSVPHIRPGILQPAVDGKLLDGTTNHSGDYGTAQSDGHSYYYTAIKGSKAIKDPRIGAHFGSQRHMFTSVQQLKQESAIHGDDVWSIDGREWCRFVNGSTTRQSLTNNNAYGAYLEVSSGAMSSAGDVKIEVVGYFNFINLSTINNTDHNNLRHRIDGGSWVQNDIGSISVTDAKVVPRFVHAGSLTNLSIGTFTTPAIHTIEIENYDGSNHFVIESIELIAQDTGSVARRNHVNIPAQNVVSYGKKFSIGSNTLTNAVHKHYNPFAFKTDGTTAWASGAHNGTSWPVGTGSSHNIDTATSLGLENWKHSNNYYKPYNGGRVVRWVASDGTIKTSVTVMPPNAQRIGGSAINAKANASVANDTYLPTFSGAIDHSLSEVAKTFHWREFGNGAANGGTGGTYADASMLNSVDDIGYVMDDGLTSLTGNNVVIATVGSNPNQSVELQLAGGNAPCEAWYTFIGTGVSMIGRDWSGAGIINYTIAQNLSYGSHILKTSRDGSNNMGLAIDGVVVDSTTNGHFHDQKEITFYQPKKPPIPEDACIIADYMLMADFLKQTGTSADIYGQISKGSRLVSSCNDHFYNSSAVFHSDRCKPRGDVIGLSVKNTSADATAKLPFFGTTGAFHVAHSNQAWTSELGGAAATETKLDNTASALGDAVTLAETVTLGQTSIQTTIPSGEYVFVSTQVATPIHTSHHYQTFETPWLRELVGGDRNMEQHNLIVTPDGKSWDEVTRDTSYIGMSRVRTDHNNVHTNITNNIFDEWRGRPSAHDRKINRMNKDFAIAYDRMICLKDGTYQIIFTNWSNTNDDLAAIYINGTLAMLGKPSTGGDKNTCTSVVTIYLKRGDYVAGGGASGDGSNQWNVHLNFEIIEMPKVSKG